MRANRHLSHTAGLEADENELIHCMVGGGGVGIPETRDEIGRQAHEIYTHGLSNREGCELALKRIDQINAQMQTARADDLLDAIERLERIVKAWKL